MAVISKIYPKDIIAAIVLIACFILIGMGINHVVSGIAIMVVTYYFSRRVDGEGVPGKDLNYKVKEIEREVREIPKTQPQKIMTAAFEEVKKPEIPLKDETKTAGDFKSLKTLMHSASAPTQNYQ